MDPLPNWRQQRGDGVFRKAICLSIAANHHSDPIWTMLSRAPILLAMMFTHHPYWVTLPKPHSYRLAKNTITPVMGLTERKSIVTTTY